MFDKLNSLYSQNLAVIADDDSHFSYQDLENFSFEIAKIISERSLIVCLCENNVGALFN